MFAICRAASAFLIGLMTLVLATSVAAKSTNATQEELKRQAVKVTTPDEVGTGILLGTGDRVAFILTAYHVVKDSKEIKVTFFDRKYRDSSATLLRFDEDLDIAVLRVDEPPKSEGPARLVIAGGISEGAQVTTIGHPADLEWQVRKSEISRVGYSGDIRKFLHAGATLARGESGGPVFLQQRGELIGIVTNRGPSGHVIAVAISGILKLIQEEWGIPTTNLTLIEASTGASKSGTDRGSGGDGFCDSLSKLTEYAARGFRGIVGEPRGSSFEPSFKFATALHGYVYPDQKVDYVLFESARVEDVEAKYYNLTDSLRSCFPTWEAKEAGPSPEWSGSLRTRRSFALRQNTKGIVVEARVLEFKDPWKPDLRLTVYVPGAFFWK